MLAKLRKDQENEEGFTLIELLVVVIIIGILAAIAIPAFLNQRERAWQSELTSTVRNVALEVESEATKYGGNYTEIGDEAAFDAFVTAALTRIQGAATPVTYDAADGSRNANAFAICMEHDQLDTGAVRYVSSAGGLQPFIEGACGGAGSF